MTAHPTLGQWVSVPPPKDPLNKACRESHCRHAPCILRLRRSIGGIMYAAHARQVADVMLRQIVTASRAATLSEAQGLMRAARLRHLLVVEDGIVVGLVSQRELLEASLANLRESLRVGGADLLGEMTIDHLVRQDPLTIPPECSLESAASRMLALRIGCLPVTTPSPRGPRFEGLITEAGLLRAAYLPPPPTPPA